MHSICIIMKFQVRKTAIKQAAEISLTQDIFYQQL